MPQLEAGLQRRRRRGGDAQNIDQAPIFNVQRSALGFAHTYAAHLLDIMQLFPHSLSTLTEPDFEIPNPTPALHNSTLSQREP